MDIRPCSVYPMVDESSDEPELFPTRKKKLPFKHFSIFPSDILKSWEVFFTKSVRGRIYIKVLSKSPENNPNFLTTASE